MKRPILHIIFFFLISNFSLQAQLQDNDIRFLEQVTERYENGYQMEVMVYAFPEASAKAIVLDSCFTARQQDNMIITTGNYDVLQTPSYTLTTNHLNKEIYLVSNEKSTQQLANNGYEFSMEDLEQSRTLFSTRLLGQFLLFEATDIDIYHKISYHFDSHSYALTKVVYEYADQEGSGTPSKVEILYRNVQVNTALSDSVFAMNRYVDQNDRVFKVNEKYQAYQLNQNL